MSVELATSQLYETNIPVHHHHHYRRHRLLCIYIRKHHSKSTKKQPRNTDKHILNKKHRNRTRQVKLKLPIKQKEEMRSMNIISHQGHENLKAPRQFCRERLNARALLSIIVSKLGKNCFSKNSSLTTYD